MKFARKNLAVGGELSVEGNCRQSQSYRFSSAMKPICYHPAEKER